MQTAHKDVNTLTALAGTFWDRFYEDDTFRSLVATRGLAELQTVEDVAMMAACACRATTPISRRILWQPIRLVGYSHYYTVPVDYIPLLTDQILTPKVALVDGLDYVVDGNRLSFHADPFQNPLLQKEPIFDDRGIVIDYSITLWAHDGRIEPWLLADCWGAVAGFQAPSSEAYRNLLCVIYDAVIGGTTELHLRQALALLHGLPLSRETPTQLGDTLSDSISFHRGTLPADVTELTIPQNCLIVGGPLSFPNAVVPVVSDEYGVSFAVHGHPEVVKRFWTAFNASGRVELGQTINPANFVLQAVMPTALVCVLRNTIRATELEFINQDYLLRLLTPPHMALFIIRL